jgi:hypothetical protein
MKVKRILWNNRVMQVHTNRKNRHGHNQNPSICGIDISAFGFYVNGACCSVFRSISPFVAFNKNQKGRATNNRQRHQQDANIHQVYTPFHIFFEFLHYRFIRILFGGTTDSFIPISFIFLAISDC